MTEEELQYAIEGLWAYDEGSVDSGIHDEMLRQRVKDIVKELSDDECTGLLSRIMRSYLTERSIKLGYGWEDALSLGEWFKSQFYYG